MVRRGHVSRAEAACSMNYFELYPGDYRRDTADLSMLEHGAFLLLMVSYYGSEKPFSSKNEAIYRVTCALNAAEKRAAIRVANEFFPIAKDGLRHNDRADAEIAKAQDRMGTAPTDRKATQAERAKRYRDRRSAMFSLLRDHGVVMPFNTSSEGLEAAVMALAGSGKRHENRHSARHTERDELRDDCDGVPRDITASRPQTPITAL